MAAIAERVGLAGALAVLGLVAVPYLVLDAGEVAVYYAQGPVSPLYFTPFAAVAVVALLAAARDRSDPAVVAGVALVVGLGLAALAAAWAVAAGAVVGSLDVDATFDYHRYAVVAAGLLLALGGVLGARRYL